MESPGTERLNHTQHSWATWSRSPTTLTISVGTLTEGTSSYGTTTLGHSITAFEFMDQSAKFTGERPLRLRYFSGLGLLSTHLITPMILRSFKLGEKLGISWLFTSRKLYLAQFRLLHSPTASQMTVSNLDRSTPCSEVRFRKIIS